MTRTDRLRFVMVDGSNLLTKIFIYFYRIATYQPVVLQVALGALPQGQSGRDGFSLAAGV